MMVLTQLTQRAMAASAYLTHFFNELKEVEDFTMARVLTEGEREVLRTARSILNEVYLELNATQNGENHE